MTKERALFQPTGAPLKVPGRYKGMWPAPVYVATFADGTTGRHSFYSAAGKPLDFERGRTGACWLWRQDWPQSTSSRRDIVSGHVEHYGQSFADLGINATASNPTKPKLDQLAIMVNKIGKLDWRALEAVQAAIDQRLAA